MPDSKDIEFISIADAAELTGYSEKYLQKLVRSRQIEATRKNGEVLISWKDVQKLAFQQKPFWVPLPNSALGTDAPDPRFLLHTQKGQREPVEFFYDKVEFGDCRDWMRRMPDGIIQSIVTSPPYWGVRKYPYEIETSWIDGSSVNFGEEQTIEEYVAHTVEILRHLKRVLREDGTIWWNMGDTYQTRTYLRESSTERLRTIEGEQSNLWSEYPNKRYSSGHQYLKDKDLTLAPFLVAIGAEHLGFYVRSIVIWRKGNHGIESVKDRPVTSHEYILLLAKSNAYKYNHEAETENAISNGVIKRSGAKRELISQKALRTVWEFATSSQHGEHTAAFPMELPLRCLTLTTSPGDLVFDPFAGSGTTLAAAKLLKRHYFGTDVVEGFVSAAKQRLLSPSEPLKSPKRAEAAQERKGVSDKLQKGSQLPFIDEVDQLLSNEQL